MQLIIKTGLQCFERQKFIKRLLNLDIYLKLLQENAAPAKQLNCFQCETAKQQDLTAAMLKHMTVYKKGNENEQCGDSYKTHESQNLYKKAQVTSYHREQNCPGTELSSCRAD